MEDGPYRHTRSSTNSNKSLEEGCDKLFLTPKSATGECDSGCKSSRSSGRTPSSQQLSKSVVDIRNYFANLADVESGDRSNLSPKSVVHELNPNGSQSKYHGQSKKSSKRKTKGSQSLSVNAPCPVSSIMGKHHQTSEVANDNCFEAFNMTKEVLNCENHFEEQLSQILKDWMVEDEVSHVGNKEDQSENQSANAQNTFKKTVRDRMKETNKSESETEDSSDTDTSCDESDYENNFGTASEGEMQNMRKTKEEPKVIDLRSVMDMFKDLKSEMRKSAKRSKHVYRKVNKVERDITSTSTDVQKLNETVCKLQSQNKLLASTMQYLLQKVKQNENKLEQIEWNNMKRSIILTGFYASKSKNQCKSELFNFFNEELGVITEIVDMYMIGDTAPKPIVLTFANLEQKFQVLARKKLLKHLMNEDGKPLFINDYLPASISELKRREKEIY